MEIDKPDLGISTYDYKHKGYRCAYCNEVVITNDPETIELLFQDAVAKLRLEDGGGANEFFLTAREEATLRESIATRERGVCIAYEQCLHYRCLALLQQPDKQETFSRLLLANRQNLVLPDENPALYTFYELNYSQVRQCLNTCVYCQREIDGNSPGFAYCEKSDVKRRCLYLHNACYLALKEKRYRDQLLDANARRNFSHFLTSGAPPIQCVEEMAARNEAWLAFAKRYELTFDERHSLNEWLKVVKEQQAKPSWREQESALWQANISEDLASLMDEIAQKGEAVVVEVVLPAPRKCIQVAIPKKAIPSCLPVMDSFTVCDQTVQPMKTPSSQLYINLSSALKQGKRESDGVCRASISFK